MVPSPEEGGNTTMFPSFRSKRILALAMALGCGLGVLGAQVHEVGVFTVKKSVENFRAGPDGQKLGTLLEGAEIERISQEGKWIRFRVEGWIWGPSLAGFEEASFFTDFLFCFIITLEFHDSFYLRKNCVIAP